MYIEIKDRWTGKPILCGEYESLKDCLEKNHDKSLGSADLAGADLAGVDLYNRILCGADLHQANFTKANLTRADFTEANLTRASFIGADVYRTDFFVANLFEANFTEAFASRANFFCANLLEANFTRTILTNAVLTGANLTGAKGLNKYLATPLHILRDQPGKIRAYKLVANNGDSPMCVRAGGKPLNYRIGATLEVPDANRDELVQCGAGINLATLDWCLREWRSGYRILIAEFESSDIAAIPIAGDGKFRVVRCTIVGEKSLEELD